MDTTQDKAMARDAARYRWLRERVAISEIMRDPTGDDHYSLKVDHIADTAIADSGAGGGVRLAPWPDFAGNPIREGDTIRHPDGEQAVVRFFADGDSPADQWRADYGDISPALRLCLQIGDKGRAVVVNTTPKEGGDA